MTDEMQDDPRREMCDLIVERAGALMESEAKAPLGMILDRMITFAAAQGCASDGSAATAAMFRIVADKIEAGVFHSLTGEGLRQ